MRVTLRPKQVEGVADIRAAFAAGFVAVLFVAPCAFGKTVVFAHITEGAAAKGKRVLILVHRRELLMQCSRALDGLGVAHGLISPHYKQTTDHVQVASVQTLTRRLHLIKPPDLIIVDEAHHALAATYRRIIAAFPRAKLLGVTASPCRTDHRGLGDIFQTLVMGPSVSDLIADGHLSKPIVYAPSVSADIAGIRHHHGDFDAAASAALLDKASITGDVIGHYRRLCDGKPAIAFCATVAHAHHMAEQFRLAGYKAAAIDGTTEDGLRSGMIRDLGNGGLNVLTSCDVISEGLDVPAVFAGILVRPTESKCIHIQQCGRVLRTYHGKPHALIVDHVGNCVWPSGEMHHGFPDDVYEWTLEGEKKAAKKADGETVQRMRTCVKCYAMNPVYRTTCEQCGHAFEPHREPPKQVEGELVEITDADKERMRVAAKREVGKARTREQLEAIARARGYKRGWADYIMRARGQNRYGGPVGEHISIKEMKGEV